MSRIAQPLFLTLAAAFLNLQASASDLNEFWRQTRERLAKEPMEAQVEPLADAVPYKDYKVTLRGLDGVRFCALLALPVQGEGPAKPWPVIVTVPGYGGAQPGVMLGECQRGYAILQVFPRGQGDSAGLWKINGDKLTAQLDRPEGAYYQGACADVIRAIDFASSREDLDRNRIALVGTSQGGGLSLVVGALDSRVKAVVAHVPFLCNFPLAARTSSLVKKLLDQAGRNDATALRTLAYFDAWQLAPQLRVPVLMSAGGKDGVCPPATIRSVYDRIPGQNKTLKPYPNLAHTSCVDFYNATWPWLDEHFRN
jgi:cephalosporin-C deacetylase